MMCAIEAAKRGRRVAVLDHSTKIGRKILISGGGRCNFTNVNANPTAYYSNNPHFCKSALSRFTPDRFIAMVEGFQIPFHEKKLGQLFCDGSAQNIVDLLVSGCTEAGVEFVLDTQIHSVRKPEGSVTFAVDTSRGVYAADSVVIATGGLSIPKVGATGFGYELARRFGIALVPTVPALDGFVFAEKEAADLKEMAGVSADTIVTCNDVSFRENILFTHAGLSGPAILQASLYWNPGNTVTINLLPETPLLPWLLEKKKQAARTELKNLISELLPRRITERFIELHLDSALLQIPLTQMPEKPLEEFCAKIHAWTFVPKSTVGYSKAEVTRGGVNTDELSSKTMESKKVPGLYFIGEVVDVTGRLGGYNYQWAWASGWASGQYV
ncbi:MAG: NAD(P)/FAD-dependent oxidoreductase [Methylotenera sp.]|nr:NAD(P)/FAD-dependent oxidoreductase [Oligoflexia bacterium]